MLPAITLWPSNDPEKLVATIAEANRDNKRIILRPGPHLTKPGISRKVQIGKNGLHITGTLSVGEFSSIKRPSRSIDLVHSDNNFGLYFVPAAPTPEEWADIADSQWKTHTTDPGTGDPVTFLYAVIVRGSITIEKLELDCNMGNQGLPEVMPSEKIEHSAMLAFSGQKYANPSYPGKIIYVAFEKVTLSNIRSVRGGYADDIWITRGYFRPNIGKVIMKNITSNSRVNNKRSTITFSGLTQYVDISKTDIYALESEVTGGGLWEELPGEDINNANRYSFWKLRNILCEVVDIAAKGQDIFMDAKGIRSQKVTHLYQLGGTIEDCSFTVQPQPLPLNRLNALVFKNVTWAFTAFRNLKGNFIGISPRPQYGQRCSATFIKNTFTVEGDLVTDEETEQHCLIETDFIVAAGNTVKLEFRDCVYDSRFGNETKTFIAKVFSRGKYTFKIADFAGIPIDRALFIKPGNTPVISGGKAIINIP